MSVTGLPSAVADAGGRYPFTVATPSNCAWTVRTDVSWADVAPGSGQGDGPLVLVVARNESRDARTVTVMANSLATRVVQNGVGCSYSLNPSSLDVNFDTARASVAVTAGAGCTWAATASESWLAVLPAGGSGSGVVTVDIAANPSDVRHAFLTIAGQRVTVTQQRR